MTKEDIFQISFFQSSEKLWWKCPHADSTTVWGFLTCWASKGVLKRSFLEIGLTKSLTLCYFRKEVAMTMIFFFKMFKIPCRLKEWNKKTRKDVGYKDKIIWIGTTNSQNPKEDTCHWQSMCYETHLIFNILLREIFLKSGILRVMKKYNERSLIQILQEFEIL